MKHHGVVTDDELLSSDHDIYAHVYPEGMQFQLVDLDEVTDFQGSMDTLRYLGEKDRELAQKAGHRRYIVVIAPSQGRRQSILWQVWAQDTNTDDPVILTKIVHSIEEAREWLHENDVDASSVRRGAA